MSEPKPMVVEYRPATVDDALCIGVLATQVFLDTYATEGIRADLAREVLAGYSPEAFAARLSSHSMHFVLAEVNACLVGFTEVALGSSCPVPGARRRRGRSRSLVRAREFSSQRHWASALHARGANRHGATQRFRLAYCLVGQRSRRCVLPSARLQGDRYQYTRH